MNGRVQVEVPENHDFLNDSEKKSNQEYEKSERYGNLKRLVKELSNEIR